MFAGFCTFLTDSSKAFWSDRRSRGGEGELNVGWEERGIEVERERRIGVERVTVRVVDKIRFIVIGACQMV